MLYDGIILRLTLQVYIGWPLNSTEKVWGGAGVVELVGVRR